MVSKLALSSFIIGYIYPGEEGVRAPRYVNMYEVDQMETLREMVVLFFRRDAVSYTHLDVYKRQVVRPAVAPQTKRAATPAPAAIPTRGRPIQRKK